MAKLNVIEGISRTYQENLHKVDIKSIEEFLEKGKTKNNRKEISNNSGISEKLILSWISYADLMRVRGIGCEFAEILQASGVDTVPELARSNALSLNAKMKDVNKEKELIRRTPALNMIESWIEQAKILPKVIEY